MLLMYFTKLVPNFIIINISQIITVKPKRKNIHHFIIVRLKNCIDNNFCSTILLEDVSHDLKSYQTITIKVEMQKF